MAAALVVSTAKASTDSGFSVTTDPIDTSGANLIYIAISRWTAGTLNSFTDSKGNTWILSEGAATLSGAGLIGYYCIDPDGWRTRLQRGIRWRAGRRRRRSE
jgi:hypothetical protein